MLTRAIEALLIALVNKAHSRRYLSKSFAELEPSVAPQDVVLGHTLPAIALPKGSSPTGTLVTLSEEARRRHLYVLGATGTGKTNLLLRLIESDIARRRGFCVVDLRGDLTDRILLRLAHTKSETHEALAERLVLLDLRQQDFAVGFNPLTGPGDIYSRAFHILGVLRQQSDSWGIQLEETLRNALLALAQTGWSLLEIEPLLSQARFRQQVLASVEDSYVRAFFRRYDQLSDDRQTAWRLPVLNKVTPLLAMPQLRRMLGQRQGLSFSHLLDQMPGRIILISLAVDRLHQAAHLAGGLLISAFQTAIMARVDQPEAARLPVHLYIDEFETMATEQFAAIIAEGRRFGLGLCLSHQNLSQLPPSLRQALRNNVHTQCYFQTGALDAQELAAEIVSKDSREAIQQALLAQGVGEVYLVRRGQPSVRVRIKHSPDPSADAACVQSLRQMSLGRYAKPKQEVDDELRERERQYYDSDIPPQPPRSRKTAPAATNDPASVSDSIATFDAANDRNKDVQDYDPPAPRYEIRHEKTRRFRPRKAE